MKESVYVNVWINRFGSIRTRVCSCKHSDEPSGFFSVTNWLVTSFQGGIHCTEFISSKKTAKKENERRKLVTAHMCILNRYLPFCLSPDIVLQCEFHQLRSGRSSTKRKTVVATFMSARISASTFAEFQIHFSRDYMCIFRTIICNGE